MSDFEKLRRWEKDVLSSVAFILTNGSKDAIYAISSITDALVQDIVKKKSKSNMRIIAGGNKPDRRKKLRPKLTLINAA